VAEGGGKGGCDGGQERPVKPLVDKAVSVVQTRLAWQHRYSDCVADRWAHAVLYFPELSNSSQTWKLKMDALPYSKKLELKLGHCE
jgi:hypothetical protein